MYVFSCYCVEMHSGRRVNARSYSVHGKLLNPQAKGVNFGLAEL